MDANGARLAHPHHCLANRICQTKCTQGKFDRLKLPGVNNILVEYGSLRGNRESTVKTAVKAASGGIKIAAVESRVVAVPLITPFHMSGETVTATHNLIVCITDSDGNNGWGEAAPAPMMTGETGPGLLEAAKFMARRLTGAVITAGDVTALTEPMIYHNHGAKAAIRTALLDLLSRKQDRPLYDLLGGRRRPAAASLVLLAGNGIGEVEQARQLVDAGIRAVKIKVGLDTVDRDLERARTIRQAVGQDIRISADANMAFDLDEALKFMQGAQDAGLDFVEQPVSSENVEGMRACAAASAVPLCVDEGLHGLADISRHHELAAAQGGNLKLIKLGGPDGVMAAARLLDQLGMKINIAGKVAETSISSAALVHLAVCVPRLDWDVSITNQFLADDIVHRKIELSNGHYAPPDGPGLGVEIDYEKLEKYTVMQ